MKDEIIEILNKIVESAFAFENYDGEKSEGDWELHISEQATHIDSLYSSGVSEILSMFNDDSNEGNIKKSELIEEQKKFLGDKWDSSAYSQGFADCFNWIASKHKLIHPIPISENIILEIEDLDGYDHYNDDSQAEAFQEGVDCCLEILSKSSKPMSNGRIEEIFSWYAGNKKALMTLDGFKAAIKELKL